MTGTITPELGARARQASVRARLERGDAMDLPELARIAACILAGESYYEAAEQVHRSPEAVRQAALRMGLKSKHKRGGAPLRKTERMRDNQGRFVAGNISNA